MSNQLPQEGEVSEELRQYLREKKGLTENTYQNHLSVVKRFDQWLSEQGTDSVLDAGPRDVRDWLQKLHDDDYAGSTIHTYHMTLRSFFKEWTETDGNEVSMLPSPLEENPAGFKLDNYINATKNPKKQQFADNNEGVIYLSPSEIRELRSHVPAPKIRNELVIKMLVQTGLRRAELSQLKIQNLDRENKHVTVEASVSKTGEERTVPYDNLNPELSLWLDSGYRDSRITADSPYLFITKQTERLSPSRITKIVRQAADEAEIQESYGVNVIGDKKRRITAHSLRSTFIMRLLEAGLPTPKVMELSGHKNLKTVENYANVLNDDAIDAYNEADIDFGTD